MNSNRIKRVSFLAAMLAVNAYLFFGTMSFALPVWATCLLSATGAVLGIIINRRDPLIGALVGSALALFGFFGFIMSAFAHLLKLL